MVEAPDYSTWCVPKALYSLFLFDFKSFSIWSTKYTSDFDTSFLSILLTHNKDFTPYYPAPPPPSHAYANGFFLNFSSFPLFFPYFHLTFHMIPLIFALHTPKRQSPPPPMQKIE